MSQPCADGMITIPIIEYNDLVKANRILDALYEAGVDNWEWFGDAMASLDANNTQK